MNTKLTKPLPTISDFNRPYWDATRNRQLKLQRCEECRMYWAPAGPVCPHCFSERYEWAQMSGKGSISSWVVFHKLYIPSFEGELPYNVAFVQLEEGPRIISNIVGAENSGLRIGMPVKVTFEQLTDDVVLPKFCPA